MSSTPIYIIHDEQQKTVHDDFRKVTVHIFVMMENNYMQISVQSSPTPGVIMYSSKMVVYGFLRHDIFWGTVFCYRFEII